MISICYAGSRNELADILDISRRQLTYVLYKKRPESYYSTFEIPKRNGGTRIICAPSGELKYIQRKLKEALWNRQQSFWRENGISPKISHAFEEGKSIITNAEVHKSKQFVLNLDLEGFFDSFHFGRVQGFFEKSKMFQFPHEVAVTIAQIACYNGRLPQGAPSSPIITNLICQIFDMHILGIAKKYKLDYTRYADDLTFSTNDKGFFEVFHVFLDEVEKEITRSGFKLNKSKTRLQFKDSRQEVTGLVVNKKINIPREYYKKTRAMAHSLYTRSEFKIDGKIGNISQLEGRFSFIAHIDEYNYPFQTKHTFHTLNGVEKQYQAFLYYKYFFANEKTVVITEGKTDPLYLKAALMKYCDDYPNLIEKDESGKYKLKISFFNRTERWNKYFGLSEHGADAMKELYYFFKPSKDVRNYFYFKKLTGHDPTNAVILLFDNETVSDRPLKKFLKNCNNKEDIKKDLSKQLYCQLLPPSNLFLLTNPLTKGKAECEIEDLFYAKTLNHKMGGKTFCRDKNFDNTRHYGKDYFSKYVYSHYESIDFKRFKPLLEALNSIVSQK